MMTMFENQETFENKDEWDPCQPGEVSAVVRRLMKRRRTAHQQAVGVAAVLMIGIGFLGYYFTTVSPTIDNYYAGISCTKMIRLAPQYASGRLDAALTRQIRTHLAQCRRCRERFEAMQTPNKLVPRTSIDKSRRYHASNTRLPTSPVVAALSVRSDIDF